jgi:hypothetical protein
MLLLPPPPPPLLHSDRLIWVEVVRRHRGRQLLLLLRAAAAGWGRRPAKVLGCLECVHALHLLPPHLRPQRSLLLTGRGGGGAGLTHGAGAVGNHPHHAGEAHQPTVTHILYVSLECGGGAESTVVPEGLGVTAQRARGRQLALGRAAAGGAPPPSARASRPQPWTPSARVPSRRASGSCPPPAPRSRSRARGSRVWSAPATTCPRRQVVVQHSTCQQLRARRYAGRGRGRSNVDGAGHNRDNIRTAREGRTLARDRRRFRCRRHAPLSCGRSSQHLPGYLAPAVQHRRGPHQIIAVGTRHDNRAYALGRPPSHLLTGHPHREQPKQDSLDDKPHHHRRAAWSEVLICCERVDSKAQRVTASSSGVGQSLSICCSTKSWCQRDGCVHARQHDVSREENEVLLIHCAHTVVDPGAVVVHAADAPAADGAVVRARGFVRAVARVAPALPVVRSPVLWIIGVVADCTHANPSTQRTPARQAGCL